MKSKLSKFKPIDQKGLFDKLENNTFKPRITPSLITVVINNLPGELSENITQAGVEYPGRALIDLTKVLIKTSN